MKLQTLSAACAAVITLSFAGGAFAAADSVIVKLATPVAEKTKFIAGGAVFICEADACVAAAPSSQTFATATCKAVVKNVGAVASFGLGGKTLDAGKIDACNVSASTQLAKR